MKEDLSKLTMWVLAVFGGEYLEKLYGFNVCKKNSILHTYMLLWDSLFNKNMAEVQQSFYSVAGNSK